MSTSHPGMTDRWLARAYVPETWIWAPSRGEHLGVFIVFMYVIVWLSKLNCSKNIIKV